MACASGNFKLMSRQWHFSYYCMQTVVSRLPCIVMFLAKCNVANLRCMQHALLSCSSRATLEADFTGIDQFNLEKDLLFNVLTECRVVISIVQLLPAYTCTTQATCSLIHSTAHGLFARCSRRVERHFCLVDHITACSADHLFPCMVFCSHAHRVAFPTACDFPEQPHTC
jgi:hypothetical protein